MRKGVVGLAVLLAAQSLLAGSAMAQREHDAKGDSFGFRFLGPVVGNRVASFAAAPGDHLVYYAGASSGGIFKSDDGGAEWKPIFDKQDVAAIGALAVAPSNPKIVYAGTGEAWAIRDIDVIGNGMYKSTDAGKTWQHIGLDD